MTSNQKNWTVLLSTMLAIGAVVLTIFEKNGVDEEIVTLTLRLTAWTSLLIYLLIFAARPLNQLVDSQKTRSMKKIDATSVSHLPAAIQCTWCLSSILCLARAFRCKHSSSAVSRIYFCI